MSLLEVVSTSSNKSRHAALRSLIWTLAITFGLPKTRTQLSLHAYGDCRLEAMALVPQTPTASHYRRVMSPQVQKTQ